MSTNDDVEKLAVPLAACSTAQAAVVFILCPARLCQGHVARSQTKSFSSSIFLLQYFPGPDDGISAAFTLLAFEERLYLILCRGPWSLIAYGYTCRVIDPVYAALASDPLVGKKRHVR